MFADEPKSADAAGAEAGGREQAVEASEEESAEAQRNRIRHPEDGSIIAPPANMPIPMRPPNLTARNDDNQPLPTAAE